MDLLSKNRILTGGIVMLILLNVAVLGTLWWQAGKEPGPPPPGRAGPREFMEKVLQLSGRQKKQFEDLREGYQRESEQIMVQLRGTRRELYDALGTMGSSDTAGVPKTEEIGRLQAKMELLTIRHFQSLRALCDEGQREKFDGLMRDVFGRVSGQPPPPPGAPAGDRPGGRGPGADRIPDSPPDGGPPP